MTDVTFNYDVKTNDYAKCVDVALILCRVQTTKPTAVLTP